ncbi:TraB/GumN family protein [Roseibacterium beibuensis]|uniref:TraB/GumN family protein n=1 Tax=[Roseibacterium] beibuensis TaxID=1193142 RepID=UPI00217E82FC|nr:TraB/GumN family protein [Roseibacterium beibuensis]MCS6624669.1 TraB/GumN family protein [Roseibacterium beibuensis]
MRFGLIAALAVSLFAATPALADPPIWLVRDADTEMVLFGSIHALPPGVEWRTARLDTAMETADLVAFEILTPGSEAEEIQMFMPFMRYFFADRPLDEVVTAETFARAAAAAAAQDIDVRSLQMMRPWAAALMLDMGADEALGRSEELGVDTILEQSLAEGRRKEALDTPELLLASIKALADMDDVEGEAMLVEVLDALGRDELDVEMDTAWAAGDIAPIEEEMRLMQEEAPRLYQALLVDRNHAWMPALTRMMDAEGRVVVVAGAAHMVGEDGLPALLRAAGYTVEGP